MTFSFPEKLPKKWLKIVKDSRGTIVKTGRDSFKILHNGKNQDAFGYQDKGPSVVGLSPDIIFGCRPHACPSVGTATSITVYLEYWDTLPKIKCAIYKDLDNTLVGYTEEWTLTAGWDGWKQFNIVWGGALIATNYILCVWVNNMVKTYQLDPAAGYYVAGDSDPYDGVFPDPCPWSAGKTWQSNKKPSIYCTYTPTLWSGKISGVTDPAEIMGVPVANIAEVMGVA